MMKYLASHRFDVALDHIHAHAAAGHIGQLLGRGMPGVEDELEDFLLGELGALGDDADGDRLLEELGLGQAFTVMRIASVRSSRPMDLRVCGMRGVSSGIIA